MKSSLVLCLLAGLAIAAVAQTAPQTQNPPARTATEGPGGHRRPPPEALAACQSLSSGAVCKFTSPHGAETGVCAAPEGRPLACRPSRDGNAPGASGKEKPKG